MPSKVYFKPVPDEDVPQQPSKPRSSPPKQQKAVASKPQGSPDDSTSTTAATPSPKQDSPTRGRSFSFRMKRPNHNSNNKNGQSPSSPASSELTPEPDEDPVMALFRARTTQRVRFSLEETPPEQAALSPDNKSSIKRFVKGALFGGKGSSPRSAKEMTEEFEAEVAKEIETAKQNPELVWESADSVEQQPDVVKTRSYSRDSSTAFVEDRRTVAGVNKLLNKARRAHFTFYRYQYAVKCHVRALEMLQDYPDEHPLVVKTMEGLNSAHHALSSYKNSANIVKMGIKYEDTGELVRALKMYTIAYRIRRDHLSRTHPSLVVLLNMLGSIQIKRGELEEAMQIYELALKDGPADSQSDSDDWEEIQPSRVSLLTRSVTYREMGTIYEKWGECDTALEMYHKSLKCIAEYKGLTTYKSPLDSSWDLAEKQDVKQVPPPKVVPEQPSEQQSILEDLEKVRISKSFVNRTEVVSADNEAGTGEAGGMELLFGLQKKGKKKKDHIIGSFSNYDVFFPPSLESKIKKKGTRGTTPDGIEDFSDVDASLTLHQIAQMHRAKGEYNLALAAYNVSLRGMKYSLGKYHPNVAAILGNMGNLRKEMGDMDAAFETYQQVLAIESYRLGLSHPDVTVTLHNIATIDAARGNHEHALALYKQVLALQRKLFGESDESLAVTSACMGDVYERIGDLPKAADCFEEALRIKMMTLGRHSLEVARLFHKLGKLAIAQKEFQLAYTCVSKAISIYRLNNLSPDDEWMVDANRDGADIDAAIALGQGTKLETRFEC